LAANAARQDPEGLAHQHATHADRPCGACPPARASAG
jgi:hypothetical protein